MESNNPFVWQGYLYAVGLFVVSVFGCLFMHHHFNINYTVGMRIRTAVITAVYRKVKTQITLVSVFLKKSERGCPFCKVWCVAGKLP